MKPGDEGYWEWRKNTGRPKALKNPKILWKHACDYFQRVDDSPYYKNDFIRGGEQAGSIVKLPNIAPYTWAGLEAYLFEQKILVRLDDYKANKDKRYTEFADIIQAIGQVMFDRNLSGTAVNAFNPSIMARYLRLADHQETTVQVEQPLFPDDDLDEPE